MVSTTADDVSPNVPAGSLRACLDLGSNIKVKFTVGGIIGLRGDLEVKGSCVSIKGQKAPSPGITLTTYPLVIAGTAVHDVTVAYIRSRGSNNDGITIRDGAYNITVNHCSLGGASDDALDITQGAHDVKVRWSILSQGGHVDVTTGKFVHNFLSMTDGVPRDAALAATASYPGSYNVSYYRNLFGQGWDRSPRLSWDADYVEKPSGLVAQVVNNLVWDFQCWGSRVMNNATANVVKNFYYTSLLPPYDPNGPCANTNTSLTTADRALVVKGTTPPKSTAVYATGNSDGSPGASGSIDAEGTQTTPYAVPVALTELDACNAANKVKNKAGAFKSGIIPRDSTDQGLINQITLPTCASAPTLTLTAMPLGGDIPSGSTAMGTATVRNDTATTGVKCGVESFENADAAFSYRRVNCGPYCPGCPLAAADTPTDIAAGSTACFALTFIPETGFTATTEEVSFSCANGVGGSAVGTLSLSSSPYTW